MQLFTVEQLLALQTPLVSPVGCLGVICFDGNLLWLSQNSDTVDDPDKRFVFAEDAMTLLRGTGFKCGGSLLLENWALIFGQVSFSPKSICNVSELVIFHGFSPPWRAPLGRPEYTEMGLGPCD